jgi:hypothetical protein
MDIALYVNILFAQGGPDRVQGAGFRDRDNALKAVDFMRLGPPVDCPAILRQE